MTLLFKLFKCEFYGKEENVGENIFEGSNNVITTITTMIKICKIYFNVIQTDIMALHACIWSISEEFIALSEDYLACIKVPNNICRN